MNTYQTLQQKALGLAFILGPLLLVIGAATVVLGIGLTPFGTDSWVDGVLSAYGFLLMIPIGFELARRLGQRAPFFGIVCAILGLGAGMSIVASAAKIIQMGIIDAGLNESIWNVMTHPSFALVMLPSILSLLNISLLGVGFLWKGGLSRLASGMLILSGIFYFAGVAGGAEIATLQTHVLTPLATLLYFLALAPLGLRYLAGEIPENELEMATA